MLLNRFFGFDLAAEANPFVKAMAVLLPCAKLWRGDYPALRNLMARLFGCKVELKRGRYSESDSSVRWIPTVRYDLLIEGLTAEEYRKISALLQPFADFVGEWFIPAEVVCQVKIKEYGQAQKTDSRLVLDYNTNLWT